MSNTRLMRLLTLCFAVGIFALLGEIGVRLFVKNADITPEVLKKHSVQYESVVFARHAFKQEPRLVERLTGRKKGLVWEINDKGYRGPNFTAKKPDGLIRIMVYGGSSVFDTESTKGRDWPHLVQERLRQTGLAQVEVINAGIMGHTAPESVGRLFAEGHIFQPDYVLIYNAWNDIKYFKSQESVLRSLRPYRERFDFRTHYANGVDRFLCEFSQLYTVLRRVYFKSKVDIGTEGIRNSRNQPSSVEPLVMNGFNQYRLAMELFVDLARNIKAVPILVTQARLPIEDGALDSQQRERIDYHHVGLNHDSLVETFNRLDAIVRDVAAKKGSLMVDASTHLSGKSWAFYDHVHFSPRGSDAMAEFLSRRLLSIMREERKGL